MGADMIYNYLVIPKDKQPDFAAAKLRLYKMTPEKIRKALTDSEQREDNPDWISLDEAVFMADNVFNIIKAGWYQMRRDFIVFPVKEYLVLFVGEMTWGDCPEGVTAINYFYALGLYQAAGFIEP